MGELPFRKDLFHGIASYYDEFRPPYPQALFDDLCARVPLEDSSRVVDLACGTGQIAFALAGLVAEVWAVDQEPDFIDFSSSKAQERGVTNIHPVTASADDVELHGAFDLVAIGNAFHRLDREAVARRLVPRLSDNGCVAVVWGNGPWSGERQWQRVLKATVDRWSASLGLDDRVPEGWESAMQRDPNEQVLRRAGLAYEGQFDFTVVERWTIDSLIGYAYSTSVLNRTVVGDQAAAFEADVRAALVGCDSDDGVFSYESTYAYQLARRSS